MVIDRNKKRGVMRVLDFIVMLPKDEQDLFFGLLNERGTIDKAIEGTLAAIAVFDPGLAKKIHKAQQADKAE